MENPDLQRTNPDHSAQTPLSFLFYLLEPDVRRKTIAEALEARAGVPLDLRNGLDRAINNCASVPGFRTAGRAPVGLLVAILDDAIQHSAELAAATARVWFCGQENLREAATEALKNEGALEAPHTAPAEMVWVGYPSARVSGAFRSYSEAHPDDDLGQATLMFQLLTGLSDVNGDPEEGEVGPISELLATTLQALDTLPSNSPEWEASLPAFAADLAKLIERKQEEGRVLIPLYEILDDLEEEHGPIIEFFQWDLASWDVENLGSENEIRRAHDKAEVLRSLLSQYSPIHERATVATVELTRAAQRMELFPLIIDTGNALQRILSGEDQSGSEDDQDSGEDSEPVCKDELPVIAAVIAEESREGNAETRNQAPNEQSEDLGLEPEPAGQDTQVPGCDIEDYLLLRLANQDLEQENDDLELENAALKEQIKALEHRLYESRSQEEGWRLALVHQENLVGEEHVPAPENVSAAVQMAQERFPSQLLFQLNADSRVEDCPFKWPNQVWDALRWLATDYFVSHLGDHPMLNIDEACRVACGMWYKTSQHETTMTQFREAYTTRVNGRVIWLAEHIGKGNSFDPRRTIRIAFDWDKQLQQVVIGYIGQHQRTAGT